MALHRFFFPGGAYSETSAPVVATRAPTPRPVRNRMIPNAPVRVRHGGRAHADGEPRVGEEHDLAPAEDVADGSRRAARRPARRPVHSCPARRATSGVTSPIWPGSRRKVDTTAPYTTRSYPSKISPTVARPTTHTPAPASRVEPTIRCVRRRGHASSFEVPHAAGGRPDKRWFLRRLMAKPTSVASPDCALTRTALGRSSAQWHERDVVAQRALHRGRSRCPGLITEIES